MIWCQQLLCIFAVFSSSLALALSAVFIVLSFIFLLLNYVIQIDTRSRDFQAIDSQTKWNKKNTNWIFFVEDIGMVASGYKCDKSLLKFITVADR